MTSSWPVSITKAVTFADVEHHSWTLRTALMLKVRWVAILGSDTSIKGSNEHQGAKSKSRKQGSMARDQLKFPRIAPSIMNCTNNNLAHRSGWASNAKGIGLTDQVLEAEKNLSC